MLMNIDDFRYMWRGKQFQSLVNQQANLLESIDIRRAGNEHALLLLHGFASSPAVFRELLPKLHTYDAIICPVLPGHGESISAFTNVKAKAWFGAAELACEKLMKDYKKVDVMGLSLGGVLGCHLSQQFSLNHLYLLAPALALQLNIKLALTSARVLRFLGFNSLRNYGGNINSSLNSEIAYRKLPLTAIIEILSMINQFQFAAPSCPTDVFLGCFDTVVDIKRVAKYFDNLSNCHLHWLSKSAHVLPLDEDVETIINCLNHH